MKRRYIWQGIGLLCMVGLIAVAVVYITRPKTIVPAATSKQLTSTLFVPRDVSIPAVRKTVKYDTSLKLVSYVVQYDGASLTVSEQPTPDEFNDSPDFYSKVVNGLEGYQTFDSPQGKVDLTRPADTGKETALMNAKGTLMFIKASKDISSDQWKQFFRQLTVQD